jgi:ammonia channel protein AmtB
MADDVQTGPRPGILSSDGRRHTIMNALSTLLLVVGLASFVLGLLVRNTHAGAALHITATATGLFSVLVGLYLQMVSATREQRVLIVTGMIAGFVGLAIGLSKGGFIG